MRGLAYAGAAHATRCSATGTLDVARYGHVLQVARSSSACAARAWRSTACTTSRPSRTTIKRGEFTQSFSLARNGLLSTLPTVPA